MADKDFKRKFRPKAVSADAVAQRAAARREDRDSDNVQEQRDVGAYYSAGPAYGLALDALPPQGEAQRDDAEVAEERMRGAPQGEPLPDSVRRRYEHALGHDLSAVRIHRGVAAERAAGDLHAHAFTHRNQIWLGPGVDPADKRVMAHELTHVIQQGHAPALPHRMALTMPTRAANSPVHAAPAGPRAAPAPTGGAVQRWSIWSVARRVGGAVVSGVRTVGGVVAHAAGSLLSLGKKALFAIIKRIAPSFLPLFQGDGIAGFLRKLIRRGLKSLFSGLTAPLRHIFNFGKLGARVTQAMTWITTIAGQLARNDCSGVLAAARRVGAFFSHALKPVIDRIKSISHHLSGFFHSIWDAVGKPVMGILRRIGGEIWQSLKGFVSDVAHAIRVVRNALGAAWHKVKGWLGIGAEDGAEEGGGLWNWIRDKATAIGRTISRAVRPIIGPLKKAGAVLLLLVPGGQLAAIILLWPKLKRAFAWISKRWHDLRLIPRARAFLVHTVFPALIHAAESVAQAFLRGADWLLGLLDRISAAFAQAVRFATGLFSPLGRLIGYAQGQFHRLIVWARGSLRYVSRHFRTLMQRLIRFLQPILDALRKLLMIAVNPFGIVGFLEGTLWLHLPECLKGVIIDFILTVITRVVRALPPSPLLGILWPVVRSALLGFLDQVLAYPLKRKVKVSDKLARIVAGQSPTFFLGFLRGIALGVWKGITAPFQAIASVFELPAQIRNFLNHLGLRLCDLVEQIRCFAANLVGHVFGSVDSILRALEELLRNPRHILELIHCAIEGILSTARTLGQQLASRMMAILEGPDDALGERLGKIAGKYLLQAVITYFTAGAGASIGIVQKITHVLSEVGRAVREAIATLRALLGRLVSFIRGLASRFAHFVADRARSVLGRLGGFFRKVADWFGRLFRRLTAPIRRWRERHRLPPAERERRKRLVVRILTRALSRPGGIGRLKLFALMTYLKVRYRIKHLRVRHIAGRNYHLTVTNSDPKTIHLHAVDIDESRASGERAQTHPIGTSGLPQHPHVVLRHSASEQPTPTTSLRNAGYRADTLPFSTIGAGDMARPNWVNAQILRWIPPKLGRPAALAAATLRKGYCGRAEELLRRGATRSAWNGGHLIGNQFGGPAAQWNLAPMIAGLNQQAFLSAETWLIEEWRAVRRPGGRQGVTNPHARVSVNVSASGYRSPYTVTKEHLLSIGVREQSVDSGSSSVTIHGFVPSHFDMRVHFQGQGAQAREYVRPHQRGGSGFFSRFFNRPERALRASTVSERDQVVMRIGNAPGGPNAPLPPSADTSPRHQRQPLVNNRKSFHFHQLTP